MAAGPLASALIAGLTAIGLGCAAAGASATTSSVGEGSAPAPTVVSSQTEGQEGTRQGLLEIQRTPDPVTPRRQRVEQPAAPREAPARRAAPTAAPEPPIVDASPRKPRSTRQLQPVRLRIDEADLDLEVRPTGVADDGSMELPGTVRRAGWYRYSALPGSRVGTTVIAAHVDTRAEGLGPFARITDVRRGDRVVVTDRGGGEHRYRVEYRRLVNRTRLPVDDLFDRNGAPRLVMITCGGAYDARNGYHDNIVVAAERDP
jgi:hypothetical protein